MVALPLGLAEIHAIRRPSLFTAMIPGYYVLLTGSIDQYGLGNVKTSVIAFIVLEISRF